MEFNFDVQRILQTFSSVQTSNGVIVIKGDMLKSDRFDRRKSQAVSQLNQIIDRMGEASAKVSKILKFLT